MRPLSLLPLLHLTAPTPAALPSSGTTSWLPSSHSLKQHLSCTFHPPTTNPYSAQKRTKFSALFTLHHLCHDHPLHHLCHHHPPRARAISSCSHTLPLMVGVGNHDFDFKGQKFDPPWFNNTNDSFGECGVACVARRPVQNELNFGGKNN